jgi:hypothetical protein
MYANYTLKVYEHLLQRSYVVYLMNSYIQVTRYHYIFPSSDINGRRGFQLGASRVYYSLQVQWSGEKFHRREVTTDPDWLSN